MREDFPSVEAPRRFDLGQAAFKVSERVIGHDLTDNIVKTFRGAQKEGGTFEAVGFMISNGLKDALIASIPEGGNQSGGNMQTVMAEAAPSLAALGLGKEIASTSGLNLDKMNGEQLKGMLDGFGDWIAANPQKAGRALVGGVGGAFAGIVISTFRGGRSMGATAATCAVIGGGIGASS